MVNVTRSGRKLKDDDRKSESSCKDSSASGSTKSDMSLTRSTGETLSMKQKATSPLSTRKSERIAKCTSPIPPLSSSTRKFMKGLHLVENRNEKEKIESDGKHTRVTASDRYNDGEEEQRPVSIVLGKKRLDARSYRKSFFKPQAKKTKESDFSKKLKDHVEASQGNNDHSGASSCKEVENEAVGIVKNAEEIGHIDAEEGSEVAEGPYSRLRKLESRRSKIIRKIELSQFSRESKIVVDESYESNQGNCSPVSKLSVNSPQSSPGVSAKEAASDAEKVLVDCSARDNLLKVSTGSTLEGKSISGDVCVKKACTISPSKGKRKSEGRDFDTSTTVANEEICTSSDPVIASPSESKSNFLDGCDSCSKRRRSEICSQECNTCSCNNGKNRDSWNDSSPEEVRERGAIVPNPESGGIHLHCSLRNGNKRDISHVDRNIREDVLGSELLLEAESVHDQTEVPTTVEVHPLEELLEKGNSFSKQSELPCRNVSELEYKDHLNFVNKLCEYCHKKQNAVICEDQEHIQKVVLFILTMQSDVCRPFLITSTSYSLSAWKTQFLRLAPSVNVVVYSGNKDVRESIRALEFYEDRGCLMFQVLLSPIDAIVEDIEALELIGWEAIVVDEGQFSGVSRHFEQIKKLTSGFRLLLLGGPIKESIAEYQNLLCFLDSDSNGDGSLKIESVGTISKLKERFARFVACGRKSDSSRFVEYWVPTRLSNVQLEQYCATLLSNSTSLCSYSKNDSIGALRDVLISVRKCCDHPYLVDQSLQSLLMKDIPEVEYLDVGVNASGKLQVLDKVLTDIKKRGLRALLLFQSIGGSRLNGIGDILDDFLRQRFGQDSYERVDSGLLASKKQTALEMFNKKERGRFVFLIENRACLPSIKLCSVDMVILFNSDWNPLTDLRALQRITIDSQFEQLKIFRLYSSFTVEEKVLSLAKQDINLDSSIQNINCSTSRMLLLWGAYFLFHKLDEFHSGSNISSEQSFLNDVVQEFLSLLPSNAEIKETENCKVVLKAQHSGASYSKDIVLLGEKEMQSRDEEIPHVLWTNVLNGRRPRWRYTSDPSQRTRRKIQLPKTPQENVDAVKKQKKVASSTVDPNTLKSGLDSKRKLVSMDKKGAPDSPTYNGSHTLLASIANTHSASCPVSEQPEITYNGSQNLLVSIANTHHPVSEQPEMQTAESHKKNNLNESQKNLHLSLNPVILKLCDILQLPDDVKSMAGKFLEYIINNRIVVMEPVTTFQAFQISLCWSAASLLKYKICHEKSLSLAHQHLSFECKEEETEYIYSKLRKLKKMFFHQAKSVEPILAENSLPIDGDKHQLYPRDSQLTSYAQQELGEGDIREDPKSRECSIQLDSSKHKQAADTEYASGSSKTESSSSIGQVQKIHSERMRKVYLKQMEEFEKFAKNREKILEKEKDDLEIKRKLESDLIHHLFKQLSDRSEKLKMLDQEFARKKEDLSTRMETQQILFEAMQRKTRDKEDQMRDQWLEEANHGRSVATYAMLPLSDSGFREENMEELEQVKVIHENSGAGIRVEPLDDSEQAGIVHVEATTPSRYSLGNQDSIRGLSVFPAEEASTEICANVPDVVEEISATEPPLSTILGQEVNTLISENATDTGSMQQRRLTCSHSGSPSLGKTLIGTPLNDDQASPSQDVQVLPFQVPGNEQAQPSLPASSCEVQNVSLLETQTSLPMDALPSNQVDNDTPVPAVQLQLSPSADPPTTEQRQPDVPKCAPISSEQSKESEAQIRPPPSEEHIENQVRHTTAQPIENPTEPRVIEQTEMLNDSASLSYPQPLQHLPMLSSVNVSGSRLSDSRSTGPGPAIPHISQQLCTDPLQNELGRIRREGEQVAKLHEDEKMRLIYECEKEVEETRRKYTTMLQDTEMKFLQRKKALETDYNMVYMNRILGEAFRLKCDGGASELMEGASSKSMAQTSAVFSSNRVRSQLEHVLSSSGYHQARTELGSPAPHLRQPFRPTTSSMPATSLSPLSRVWHGQLSLTNPSSASSRLPHTPNQRGQPLRKMGGS